MADFQPGDRVMITTDYYSQSKADYNGGNGVVVQKGCGSKCVCGDYYEVLHDLDASEDTSWAEALEHGLTTPYAADELTKID